jgi:hypothetical protein
MRPIKRPAAAETGKKSKKMKRPAAAGDYEEI